MAKIKAWLIEPTRVTKALTSHFSMTRKILRLAHALEPYSELSSLQLSSDNYLEYLNGQLSVASDLSDDVICLAKMNILDSKWIDKMTPVSDRCWFMTIWLDMYENTRKTLELIQKRNKEEDEKNIYLLEQKIFMQRVSMVKLLSDLVFCSVDVFYLGDRVNPGWQNVSGLVSAVLGTFKLYVKHAS
jgi:hypothetical protein